MCPSRTTVSFGPTAHVPAPGIRAATALGTAKFVLAAGASMVLLPQFNARRYVEAIGRFKFTWVTSVPTMLALALRERETLARTDLTSVEFIRAASAPITQLLVNEVRRIFPKAVLNIG